MFPTFPKCSSFLAPAKDSTIHFGNTGNVRPHERRGPIDRNKLERYGIFRSIVEQSVDALVCGDYRGKIIFFNAAAERLFGYRQEEITGKAITNLMPSRYRKAHREGLKRVISGGEARLIGRTVELTARRKDGSQFPVELSLSTSGTREGVVFTGFIRDITQRKDAEREITRLARKSEILLDSAGQGIYGVDREGLITFINPAGAKVLGYKVDELMGRNSHALIHHTRPDGEPYPESECPIYGAYRKKTMLRVTDELFFRKDGSGFPVEYTVNSLWAKGDAAGAVVVFDDITERLRAEAELMTVNRSLKALSQCNERLVRAVDEKKLLHEICAIMVDTGGYRMAWAGYAVAGAKVAIRPVAFAGENREFFQKLPGVWKATETREDPVRKAIRSGEAVLIRDLAHDRRHIPWREEALRHGFAALAAYPLRVHGRVQGLICIYSGASGVFDAREAELLVELADDLAFGLENIRTRQARDRAEEKSKESLEKLKLTVDGTTQALAMAAEARDPYTAGHQRRVAALACAMAEEMDLDSEVIDCLHVAGMLHDVGKISIPAEILTKPGALSKLEMNMVKEHAEAGFNILSQVKFPWPVARIVRQHHERLDGTGYPLELTGSDILTEARILAIADTVEAMTSHRPYRPGLGPREALAEIERGRGRHFDPEAVDACLRLFAEKRFEFEKAA